MIPWNVQTLLRGVHPAGSPQTRGESFPGPRGPVWVGSLPRPPRAVPPSRHKRPSLGNQCHHPHFTASGAVAPFSSGAASVIRRGDTAVSVLRNQASGTASVATSRRPVVRGAR